MRPTILTPLFASVSALDGIGPRLKDLLKRLFPPIGEADEPRVVDLLFHLPTSLIDRRYRPRIAEAFSGQLATLEVRVVSHSPPPPGNRRAPYRVRVEDGSGELDIVFFHGDKKYLHGILPVGESRIISGKLDLFDGHMQMPHPDHIVPLGKADDLPMIEPVYRLTAGLSAKVLRRAIDQAVHRVPRLTEWQDPAWRAKQEWPDFKAALRMIHEPQSEKDIEHDAPARQRVAYDELLANQLALGLVRRRIRKAPGRSIGGTGQLGQAIRDALPFALTQAQETVSREIAADMEAPDRMLRLLQGDVGAGKTVVALLAMARAIEAGCQTTLMAPTEVLARQHLKTLTPLGERCGFTVALLTGREKGRDREAILERLSAGDVDILIGTHALFQQGVDFRDLGLAVIDEQHRFGVHQRLALQAKAGKAGTDVLVMTATPIPRTLLLTHYGDMEVSRLTGKPAGRKPVATRALPVGRLADVVQRLREAVEGGAQAYWVCPLVEESDTLDVAAAEQRYAALKKIFSDRVALVHGRMRGAEKDRVMTAFAEGQIAILVATTVIEVGVDVPNATIMVIEHSERFGLAQLHQLRGRVGRGEGQSACILLYQGPLGETAKKRLTVMRDTEDGFVIAEEDLRLRGGGEVLGTRQSGLPEFRVAMLPEDEELLAAARDDARLILGNDPDLSGPRGDALRTLLYLFERDEAVRLLKAG